MPLVTARRRFARFLGSGLQLNTWVRYLLPFGAIAGVLVLQFLLQHVIPRQRDFPYAIFYLVSIFVVSWFGGYLPGAISCLLTMVAVPALANPSFRLSSVDPSRLILLIGVSLLVSRVAHVQRRAKDNLRRANDELDHRVRERTSDLARAVEALESEVVQHERAEQKLKIQLERLNLLDQITRAMGERQDLLSIFQVTVRSLEDNLPVDLCCISLYNPEAEELTVTCIGRQSETLAMDLAITDQAHIPIDKNGLSRCVRGQLVYEPDISQVDYPFPQRLSRGGVKSLVMAPLLVESKVFGVLIAARREQESFSSSDCEFLRQLSEHVALAAHQSQVHEALQQAYNDLRQTQQTVMQQERLRALGQMASGIAHDINNAISPVALYTEMILAKETGLSPRVRGYLETTRQAIEDVAHTVSRMREFYRKQDSTLLLAPVDLNHLIQQVLDLTRARWSDMAQKRGAFVEVRTELTGTAPTIAGIEAEIREALINLVFNAVDAMPDGGALTIRTLEASSSSGTRHVHVEVSDTGVGMSEETRRRCLEPFFTTKGERGTGLGLAMVYGVTQRHSADIEIDSTAGVGTTVRLKFPVPSTPMNGQIGLNNATSMPPRLRLLVVDDDPLLIKSLRDTLESDGHAVTVAHGGKEGIDTFTSSVGSGEPFDLVITDLGMPYVDGRKVARAVKSASPATSVLLLTGWGQRLVTEGDVPPHVDMVLNKPPKLRELRSALAELANGKAVSQEKVLCPSRNDS